MMDAIDIEKLRGSFTGHTGELGLRYVAHGKDWAEMAFDYDPRFAMDRSTGILASGPIISLIDSVSGLSIMAKIKRMRPMATLDLRIDYMRSAPAGRSITARATCYRVTRHVAFVRCEAHDGDPHDLVAQSMSSFFFTAD
ncbi:PaaI family thioesterase [Rhizorhabdus argentea]|uniref:PaaI family thioesterase n=1 Tax=Rhizorhabdus argentea TaxID=1387174 RepID=UPI0030ECB7C9